MENRALQRQWEMAWLSLARAQPESSYWAWMETEGKRAKESKKGEHKRIEKVTSLIVSLFTFFLLAQSCSSPSIQKLKVECLCSVLSFLCTQPRKAIYRFISSLPIILAKRCKSKEGARNWSLNIFGSQLNHESFGLDS